MKRGENSLGLLYSLRSRRGALSVVFAAMFAFFISSLPNENFLDYANYVNYARFSELILYSNFENGVLRVLFNEPLWLFLNVFAGSIFPPEIAVRFIILFSTFLTASIVLRFRVVPLWAAILLITIPLVLKNHLVHLRQGVAVAIFLIGWSTGSFRYRAAASIVAGFVHSSFMPITLLCLLAHFQSVYKFGVALRVVSFLILCGAIVFSFEAVLIFSGARQGETSAELSGNASGFAFLFWLSILIIFFAQGRDFLRSFQYEVGFIFFYLTSYLFLAYSGRIFESVILTVFFAGFSLSGSRRIIFILCFLILVAANWYIVSGLPLLGFGIDFR